MSAQQGYLLVVDDVPDILELLNAMLKFKGYRVLTAHDGQEALACIERERPALIIADILMPRMDGFTLVNRLRLNPKTRDIPVIFLSATYVAPEDKAFALTIGVTRFIEKPVDVESFLPMIAEYLTQGPPAPLEPLSEYDFYTGYRKRLEVKLKQKNTQIARDQHLLGTLSESEKPSFEASLHQAISDRDEMQHLISQIRELLENKAKPE
jgi:CheY-like chemotaxis protein